MRRRRIATTVVAGALLCGPALSHAQDAVEPDVTAAPRPAPVVAPQGLGLRPLVPALPAPAAEPAPVAPAGEPLVQTWAGLAGAGPIAAADQGPLRGRQIAEPGDLVADPDVVRSPASPYSARFTAGDGTGSRSAEIYAGADGRGTETEGSSGYYAFSVYLPAGFRSDTWTIVHQMHGGADGAAPAFDVLVDKGRLLVVRRGGPLSAPVKTTWELEPSVTTGVWHDFVYFARWSGDDGGELKVWHRVPSVSPGWDFAIDSSGPIGYVSDGGYVAPYPKFGIDRSAAEPGTTTVHIGGFRLHAPTFEGAASVFGEVDPAPVPLTGPSREPMPDPGAVPGPAEPTPPGPGEAPDPVPPHGPVARPPHPGPVPDPLPAPDPIPTPDPVPPDPGQTPDPTTAPPVTGAGGVLEQLWSRLTAAGPITGSEQGPLQGRQLARSDSLVASTDVHRGSSPYSAKFTVDDGDQPGSSSGERAEIYTGGNGRGTEAEGTSGYYSLSVFLPAGFHSQTWTIFHQMHGASSGTSPALDLLVDRDRLLVIRRGGPLSSLTKTTWVLEPSVTTGVWHDFVYYVHWSGDSTGVLKVWHRIPSESSTWDLAVDSTGPIGYRTASGYVRPYPKFGIYRSAAESGTTTIYHAGFRLHAASFADAASIFG